MTPTDGPPIDRPGARQSLANSNDHLLADVRTDISFAARGLRKNLGFTATALLTLALGIGVSTAVFTVVNGVLLKPLPYANPSRLEIIWLTSDRPGLGNEIPVSAGFFADIEADNKSFSSVAAFHAWRPAMTADGQSDPIPSALVTPALFTTLGVQPAIGRDFSAADAQVGAAPVAVISDGLWRRRFGADPKILGRRVDLEGRSFAIIGVMPGDFAFPRGAEFPAYGGFGPRTDLWAPLSFSEADRRDYRTLVLFMVGRLRPDIPEARGRTELTTLLQTSLKKQPPRNNRLAYDMIDMQSQAGRHVRGALGFLMAAVVLVLFIACANVGGLILARTTTRRREFAVRAALGAGRARLGRQILVENILLVVVGGALGVGLSALVTRAILALLPTSLPRADDVSLDWRVLGATTAVITVIAFAFALASAAQVRSGRLAETLRDASARSNGGRRLARARYVLIAGEICLAVMLVAGSLLLSMSFYRLSNVEPGFQPSGGMSAGVILPLPAFGLDSAAQTRVASFYAQLVQRLAGTPGIASAAAASDLPLTNTASRSGIRIAGEPPPEQGRIPLSDFSIVQGPFFRTMGIPVVSGREFDATDRAESVPVIIVNRLFEKTYLGGTALGKQLLTPFDRSAGTLPRTVVGVVEDVSSSALDEPARPHVYLSGQQVYAGALTVVVRGAGDAGRLLSQIRQEVTAIEPRAAIDAPESLEGLVETALARQRFSMVIMATFASAALFLTVVGLYGVITLRVGERRREMGIRMALGARPGNVIAIILGEGWRVTLAGILLGLVGAFGLNRFATSMLYEVRADSAMPYGMAALVTALIAMLATYAPARRAARVDPAISLRPD